MRIAALDVAPEVLADFAPVISGLTKIVGSYSHAGAIRLAVEVPDHFGSAVQVIAERTQGQIVYRLVDAK